MTLIGKHAVMEQLLAECIDIVEVARQAWNHLREMLLHDPNGDEVESTGQTLVSAISRLIPATEVLQNAVGEAVLRGHAIQGSAKLQTALLAIREVSAHLDGAFPVFDTSSDEDDIAAFKRGEYLTTEELFRELQGSGPAAD